MKVKQEYDDAFAAIEVHPRQNLVKLTWKGHVSGEYYRSILMCLMDIVAEQDIKLWLSDGRRMGPIAHNDQEWTMNEYTPMVLSAGLERIAIVSSSNIENVVAVDRMVDATPTDASYDIGFFEDPAIGQLWLMESAGTKVRQNGSSQAHFG